MEKIKRQERRDEWMKVLAIANYMGERRVLGDLQNMIKREGIDFILFAGGILRPGEGGFSSQGTAANNPSQMAHHEHEEMRDVEAYEAFFKGVGELKIPAFYIPGSHDAPIERYMREAFNHEIVFPHIRNVHKTFSIYRGHYEIVGIGGEITEKEREERRILRYPRWEVEYHLKIIRDLRPLELIMLFHTPPYGGRLDLFNGQHRGSEVVEDFIKTYDPTFAVVGSGAQPGEEIIGTSLVINPGSLKDGQYAIINLRRKEVRLATL
jgi:hypothetical protein